MSYILKFSMFYLLVFHIDVPIKCRSTHNETVYTIIFLCAQFNFLAAPFMRAIDHVDIQNVH